MHFQTNFQDAGGNGSMQKKSGKHRLLTVCCHFAIGTWLLTTVMSLATLWAPSVQK